MMQCSERNLIKIQQHLASISLLMQSNSLNPNPYCTNEEMKKFFFNNGSMLSKRNGGGVANEKLGKVFN